MKHRVAYALLLVAGALGFAACGSAEEGDVGDAPEHTGSSAQAETVTRTSWQMERSASVVAVPVGCHPSPQHGAICEYAAADVPAENDPGWGPAPDPNIIDFHVTSRVPSCFGGLDFTYFQTLVTVPVGVTVSTFTITFSGMDDGARISIYNSMYPSGLVLSGSYVFLSNGGTTDLHSYVVSGEVNRVVVTQVDDCPTGNNLGSAVVVLNGNNVVTAVCGNGILEAGEECDDGNTVSGDGCSSTCKTETCIDIQRDVNANIKDAYVDADAADADTNYGAVPNMLVGDGPSPQIIVLSPDVSSIPSEKNVSYANLRITQYTRTGAMVLSVNEATTALNEMSTTYETLGALGPSLATAENAGPGPAPYFPGQINFSSAGLTSLVGAWVSGTKPASTLVIQKESGAGQSTIRSGEHPPPNDHPQLRVCYTD